MFEDPFPGAVSVEPGEVLGNVSEACRRLSVSRQHYYDIKKTLQEEGVEGLMEIEAFRDQKDRKTMDLPQDGLELPTW
jgi:hypothetical protein